jgi:hypothetical protein
MALRLVKMHLIERERKGEGGRGEKECARAGEGGREGEGAW